MNGLTLNEAAAIVGTDAEVIRIDLKRSVISARKGAVGGRDRIVFSWEELPLLAVLYGEPDPELWESSVRHRTFERYHDLVVPAAPPPRLWTWKRAKERIVATFEPDKVRSSAGATGKSRHRREAGWWLRIGKTLVVDIKPGYDRIAERADLYSRGIERIESNPDRLGGEPVFKNTRLAIRQIGAMHAGGDSAAEIRADYPYLSREDVEFAKLYWQANPPVGRPGKRKAAVRHEAAH